MRFISVSILFVCLLAATFSQWWMITAYALNQSYIAKEFCVNKTSPANHCNGHCFLNKQLGKEEQPSSPISAGSEKFEIQLFCIEMPVDEFTLNAFQKSFSIQPQCFTAQPFIQNFLQPPEA
jgi:hypothetical protein